MQQVEACFIKYSSCILQVVWSTTYTCVFDA